MRKFARASSLVLLSLGVALLVTQAVNAARGGHINVASVSGSINPASADYLIESIATSERDGAAALLIELDTPGGLVASTRDILQAMLNADVPIIVYVTPRGAWAISAGTFITVAANVAAMSPGTSIGAAHPVSASGGTERQPTGEEEEGANPVGSVDVGMEKAENALAAMMESIAQERNRNVEWVVKAVRESVAVSETKALELGVIDLIADNRAELLKNIEGRVVRINGEERTLAVAGLPAKNLEMTLAQVIFNFLADPNVAILLFMAGGLGLYAEFNSPGLIVPGVLGVVCMVLAGIAFQILPFDWVGLILILAGLGLFVAEMFFPTFGVLFALGVVCMLLGGTMIFDQPDFSDLTVSFWGVLVPAVAAMAVFGGLIVFAVGRAMMVGQIMGVDELVGLVGKTVSKLEPEGKVFVRGEYWNAAVTEEEEIEEGAAVEVASIEGLHMTVRRAKTS
ncbi:MAG: nodulation protein NfeD [Myxococcota bacterium]|nr:nodulation protein NfeD [Myxococcota bacterium]